MVVNELKIFTEAYLCGKGTSSEELKRRLAASNPGSMVQVIRGSAARNEVFVEMLSAQTLHAELAGSMLAKKPEIDFLLRMAGTTQISRAIGDQGAKAGDQFLLVVAGRTPPRGTGDLKDLELPRMELSAAELRRIEKAALLNAERA